MVGVAVVRGRSAPLYEPAFSADRRTPWAANRHIVWRDSRAFRSLVPISVQFALLRKRQRLSECRQVQRLNAWRSRTAEVDSSSAWRGLRSKSVRRCVDDYAATRSFGGDTACQWAACRLRQDRLQFALQRMAGQRRRDQVAPSIGRIRQAARIGRVDYNLGGSAVMSPGLRDLRTSVLPLRDVIEPHIRA